MLDVKHNIKSRDISTVSIAELEARSVDTILSARVRRCLVVGLVVLQNTSQTAHSELVLSSHHPAALVCPVFTVEDERLSRKVGDKQCVRLRVKE
jgi:hypothetical protein